MTKNEVKNVVTRGMMQYWGASKERILVKFDNWCEKSEKFRWTTKKVVINFTRGIQNIFKGIQEARWLRHPTAYAHHWFPQSYIQIYASGSSGLW